MGKAGGCRHQVITFNVSKGHISGGVNRNLRYYQIRGAPGSRFLSFSNSWAQFHRLKCGRMWRNWGKKYEIDCLDCSCTLTCLFCCHFTVLCSVIVHFQPTQHWYQHHRNSIFGLQQPQSACSTHHQNIHKKDQTLTSFFVTFILRSMNNYFIEWGFKINYVLEEAFDFNFCSSSPALSTNLFF